MTPAEHIDRADRLISHDGVDTGDWDSTAYIVNALEALTHAVIAIAVELGVPHQSAGTAAASSG